ncbi:MAG: hypothetical protein ABI886_11150 [Betaproteobacteria bacterium]
MNEAPAHRLAAMTGLALAAAIAVWWLGSTRLALDHGTEAGRCADDALQALLLVRVTALAIVGVRVGALRGFRPGVTAGLGLIAPSWPVVVLAWSAGTSLATHVALTEVLLLAISVALPMVGLGLQRLLRNAELAVVTGTVLGTALVALAWVTRGFWYLPSL